MNFQSARAHAKATLRLSGCLVLCLWSASLLTGCVPVVLGGSAVGLKVAQDRRTAGALLDDQTIEVRARNLWAKDKLQWKQSRLVPVSYNGILLMVGQTPDASYRQWAEEQITDLPRIRSIHNEITLEHPLSATQRAEDSWITTSVKTQLLVHRLGPGRIKVVTENGVVYLLGLVTPAEEDVALNVARDVTHVRRVVPLLEHVLVQK